MSELVRHLEHLWQKRHTSEGKKLIRYSMVSVVSTAVSFVVLAITFSITHAEVGSTVFANVVATIPSYFLTRMWAWGKSGKSHLWREIVPFWTMSVIGIAFSMVGAKLAQHFNNVHHLSHHEATAVVLAANLFSFGIFWVLKYVLYNRLFRVHPVEELDELVEAA